MFDAPTATGSAITTKRKVLNTPSGASLTILGQHEPHTIGQMTKLMEHGDIFAAAICADGHLGYSQPIGGVVGYRGMVSPSGVGFDIACGNKAAKTDLTYGDIKDNLSALADRIFAEVEFGMGRKAQTKVDHDLFDDSAWDTLKEFAGRHTHDRLKAKARNQLGTVGSGNHYVDVFTEGEGDDAPVWVGVHFGSRGFGHGVTTGFLKLGVDMGWDYKPAKGERYEREEPTLFGLDTDLGRGYHELMNLAGKYAYAGRDAVVEQVVGILGGVVEFEVHNHHNFAWEEEHGGETITVIRKGATPLFPGQQSFIGGSMTGISVIVEGLDTEEAVATMRSTVHGAGRVMGRMMAKGKACKRCKKLGRPCEPGEVVPSQETQPCDGSGWTKTPMVTQDMMDDAVKSSGIELRGAGVDESPFVYRELPDVLKAHEASTKVLHTLTPVIVCMAGADVRDPYKD